MIDKILSEVISNLYKDKNPSGSFGGKLIEIIGDELSIPSKLIKGSKVLLGLQQGETDYKLVVSIDDGTGSENAIQNDVVRITTASVPATYCPSSAAGLSILPIKL